MKIAAFIISQFSRGKSEEPDAFEKRLSHFGTESQRRNRVALPSLFIRRSTIA